jgi:hypothetical protein
MRPTSTLQARRLGAVRKPRKTVAESDARPGSRHIPNAVKRAVRERDGDRCAYVDQRGRRCSERRHLQFHHRHPHGFGGDRSPENVSLRCAQHNRYEAEHDYGLMGGGGRPRGLRRMDAISAAARAGCGPRSTRHQRDGL